MKQEYRKPTLKVVEFKAESGFAGSNSFIRATSDAMLFEMTFDEAPRNERFSVDDWCSSSSSDGTHFSHENWGTL